MDNIRSHDSGHSQFPKRSILKSARTSRPTSESSLTATDRTAHSIRQLVHIRDPPVPTQASQRTIRDLANLPDDGPIPSITLPPTQNIEQLEELVSQLASRLKKERLRREDEASKRQALAPRLELPQPAPPRPPAGRPTYKSDDFPEFKQILVGPWIPGPGYGPVCDPCLVAKFNRKVILNPHLLQSSTNGILSYLIWSVTEPPASAKYVRGTDIIPFEEFQDQPATIPRLPELIICSRILPWSWEAVASDKEAGVTVGDVLLELQTSLAVKLGAGTLKGLGDLRRSRILTTYRLRCPEDVENREGPRGYDMLHGKTRFGGMVHDQTYEGEGVLYRHSQVNLFVEYLS